jgi:hypothetical protein
MKTCISNNHVQIMILRRSFNLQFTCD